MNDWEKKFKSILELHQEISDTMPDIGIEEKALEQLKVQKELMLWLTERYDNPVDASILLSKAIAEIASMSPDGHDLITALSESSHIMYETFKFIKKEAHNGDVERSD